MGFPTGPERKTLRCPQTHRSWELPERSFLPGCLDSDKLDPEPVPGQVMARLT